MIRYIRLLVLGVFLYSGGQASRPYLNGWEPDRLSRLRMTTGFTAGVYSVMALSGLYHIMRGIRRARHHKRFITEQATRERRMLTALEAQSIASSGRACTASILSSFWSGLFGKSDIASRVASWALIALAAERIQWSAKRKGGSLSREKWKPDGFSKLRMSKKWRVGVWGTFAAALITQMIVSAHDARDAEKARLKAKALESGSQMTLEERDRVRDALDFAANNPNTFLVYFLYNMGNPKGGLKRVLPALVIYAAFAERLQWGLKSRDVKS